jgi:hypothetical protein
MRADIYTKAILTVIAVSLVLIACNRYINPAATVSSEGPFAGVQFLGNGGAGFLAIDTRTGDIWLYSYWSDSDVKELHKSFPPGYRVTHLGKLDKLGAPANLP